MLDQEPHSSNAQQSAIIVGENRHGWIVDSLAALTVTKSNASRSSSDEENNLQYSGLSDLFQIEEPFRMDSNYDKLVEQKEPTVKRKKGKKRKAELNPGEKQLQDYYDKVKDLLDSAHGQLVDLGKKSGYFLDVVTGSGGNNAVARLAALSSVDDNLEELCQKTQQQTHQKLVITNADAVIEVPVSVFVDNACDTVIHMQNHAHQYIIPPRASLLLSDIQHVHKLLQGRRKYHMIIIDPPWENKSVKRKKMYSSLSNHDLLSLPVPDLMAPAGSIVAVWVTNKQAQQRFVTDTLFPAFGLKQCAQWYWLKVTKKGEPVCPLVSPHKKPFESILLGCDDEAVRASIPQDQVIVSVPCAQHSRKPPLNVLLEKLVPPGSHGLEMFARNLLPGWTSWGNQVLKFQNEAYFRKVRLPTNS